MSQKQVLSSPTKRAVPSKASLPKIDAAIFKLVQKGDTTEVEKIWNNFILPKKNNLVVSQIQDEKGRTRKTLFVQ